VSTRAIVAAPAEGGFACIERRPPRPREGELTVALSAAGICRTDLFVARGQLPARTGLVLGHEASGVVVDGDPSRVGQRVVVVPTLPCGRCARCVARPDAPWSCTRPRFLGLDADGVFAERFVISSSLALPVPDTLTDREAAFVEPLAAALAVLDAPLSGDIAVHGDGRIAALIRRVVDASGHRTSPLPVGAREAFDVVIETTTEDLSAALDALRPGGVLVAKSRPARHAAIDWRQLVHRELRIQGVKYASFLEAIRWLAERRIEVADLFGPSFRLDAAGAAFARAEAGEDLKLFFETDL
jgi:L-iditol 2-dehydrogenase